MEGPAWEQHNTMGVFTVGHALVIGKPRGNSRQMADRTRHAQIDLRPHSAAASTAGACIAGTACAGRDKPSVPPTWSWAGRGSCRCLICSCCMSVSTYCGAGKESECPSKYDDYAVNTDRRHCHSRVQQQQQPTAHAAPLSWTVAAAHPWWLERARQPDSRYKGRPATKAVEGWRRAKGSAQ